MVSIRMSGVLGKCQAKEAFRISIDGVAEAKGVYKCQRGGTGHLPFTFYQLSAI